MTLVEEAVLDCLRQKQIAQEIQQPEISAMGKIMTQKEDTLSNSQLPDTEKFYILECAEKRYGKRMVSMRTKK